MKSYFDEERMVLRQNIIELKSIFDLDPSRDIWTGNVTGASSRFVLVAENGTPATLRTAERAPYPPGHVIQAGEGALIPAVPVGGQGCRIGIFDDNDGWFYLFTAKGLELVIRNEGDDKKEFFGHWNNKSVVAQNGGFTFRPADGYILEIETVWYGFGPSGFNFQLKKKEGDSWIKSLYESTPEGETSVDQPHLPLNCEVFNEAGEDPFTVYITGRQVNVIGDYDPISRETCIEVDDVALTASEWRPMVSVRRKAIYPYALTKFERKEVFSDQQVRIAVVENAPDPGTGWTGIADIKDGLTLLEQNVTAAAESDLATAGNLIGKYRVAGDVNGNDTVGSKRTVKRTPLIEDRVTTVYGRLKTGASDTTADGTFTWREDY